MTWTEILKDSFEKRKKLRQSSILPKGLQQNEEEHFSYFLKKGGLPPSSKDSDWKITNKNPLFKQTFPPLLSLPESTNWALKEQDIFSFQGAHKILFQNGHLKAPFEKLPKHLKFSTWEKLNTDFPIWSWISSEFKEKGDAFYQLANSFPISGYVLYVPPHCKVNFPIHIHLDFDSSNTFWNLRNFIYMGEGAELTLIETVSSQKNLVNNVTNTHHSNDSSLKWIHLDQGQTTGSFYLNQVHSNMYKKSQVNRLSLSLGSELSRDTIEVNHLEEEAHSVLLGLALLKETSWRDQRFYVNHLKKQGYSRQFTRGILNDKAKNIFHGKVYVSPESAQTDCAQSVKSLLLSSRADSYSQPEMEIGCGEVKAKHGATVGQLNEDEMFYLQTRGLEKSKAFQLLVMSYINEVLNQFPEKNLIQSLKQKIQKNKNIFLNLR